MSNSLTDAVRDDSCVYGMGEGAAVLPTQHCVASRQLCEVQMTKMVLSGVEFEVLHSAGGHHDSETLEFYREYAKGYPEFVFALVYYDQPVSPLLVYAPAEVPLAVLLEGMEYVKEQRAATPGNNELDISLWPDNAARANLSSPPGARERRRRRARRT